MPTNSQSVANMSSNEFLAKIQLLDLALAARCAQDLNLRRAAEHLDNMGETIASRRLKRLETQLGTRLFDRSTRSMTLSNDGKRLVRQIEHVMAALNDLQLLCEDVGGDVGGKLRLGAGPSLSEMLAKRFVPDFLARYPKIQLRLHSVTKSELDHALDEMDLVITLSLPSSEAVGVRRLGKLQTGFYANADYLKAHAMPQHPRELVDHRILLPSGAVMGINVIPWIDEDGSIQSLTPLEVHSCDTMSALLALACQGVGISLVPTYLHDFVSGELTPIFEGRFGPSFDIYAVYPSARLMPKRVSVFLDELLEAMNADPRFHT